MNVPQSPVLIVADLNVDILTRRANRGDRKIRLTSHEFALLKLLMENSPNTVSKEHIRDIVWKQAGKKARTNIVNVYIFRLRRKIDLPRTAPLIHTVQNAGFRLAAC